MKFKIEINNGTQVAECIGHPLDLLMELSAFFSRNEDIAYLIKHAIELANVAEEHIKHGDNLNNENEQVKSGTKIIADFMKRYEK